MLETLSRGEHCVCDLQRVVGSDLSTVSKHLTLMRSAGLVAHRRQGLQIFYRLTVPCIMSFFDCVDAVRSAHADALPGGDAVRAAAGGRDAPRPRGVPVSCAARPSRSRRSSA